ncbi:hypothetical protein KSC_102780 [Ktedonobacter sp. SOSP1-52]|uniref:hypothetical protein n=1 Tax=Ktedonobacter sp. SOSP1-52 TaxID=2778366 RepID=UPI001A2B8783|nr:hypothetical protein [Ktedonobacter sp. SOSP1-52]GHO71386.1 hypothetical protein KSC_102780 [Ktedonobacter sp. SOSP1-52]
MIPVSHLFDQTILTALLDHDPVVQDYRQFFALLDWSLVEQWERQCSSHRRPPLHPETAYIEAFLVRIREGLIYSTQLRHILLKHPLLIMELGFHLELDPLAPYDFDAHKALPSRYWFGEKLRTLDASLLQQLLQATVKALQAQIPGLGETVAFDVKHIYSWVKENNLHAYITERFDKQQVLAGDPDCRLGVKRSTNQEQTDGTTKEKKGAALGLRVWRGRYHHPRLRRCGPD